MSQNERVMLEWSASVSFFKSSWDKSRFILDYRDSIISLSLFRRSSFFSTPDIAGVIYGGNEWDVTTHFWNDSLRDCVEHREACPVARHREFCFISVCCNECWSGTATELFTASHMMHYVLMYAIL